MARTSAREARALGLQSEVERAHENRLFDCADFYRGSFEINNSVKYLQNISFSPLTLVETN